MFKKILDWPFLQEPAYRWAIFVGLMLLIFYLWRVVLTHMKAD
jgi:hypothetical protein